MHIFTTKPKPLKLTDNTKDPYFAVVLVTLAVPRSNREYILDIDYQRAMSPETECWFHIKIQFPWRRADQRNDVDAIITNGEEYYLINTSLIASVRKKKRIEFNQIAKNRIDDAINSFISEKL